MRLELDQVVSSSDAATTATDSQADIQDLLSRGISAARSGDRRNARLLLNRVTETDGQNVDAWLWLASISEYPEELLAFLDRVLEIDESNDRAIAWRMATCTLLARTHIQRAEVAAGENDLTLAHQCLEQALAHDSSSIDAWTLKAKLSGDTDAKHRCYEKVLTLDPENETAQEWMLEQEAAKFEAALAEVKDAAAAGDSERGNPILAELLEAKPDSVELWLLKAQLADHGDAKAAAYKQILELDPENESAHQWMRDQEAAKFEAALLDVKKAAVSGDAPQANALLSSLIEAKPDSVDLWLLKSQLAVSIEDKFDAYTRVLELDPGNALASMGRDMLSELATAAAPAPTVEVAAETAETQTQVEPERPTHEADADYEFLPNGPVAVEGQDAEASEISADAAQPETESETAHFPQSFAAEEAARYEETYASPFAETCEYTAEDVIDHGYVPPVPGDQPLIHETDADQTYMSCDNAAETVTETCPFCNAETVRQVFECPGCKAVLSLSNIEALLAASPADRAAVQTAVAKLTAEWNVRKFTPDEMQMLALGHFNLKNTDLAFSYLQEAAQADPNNVILAGQVNAVAIRLGELKHQNERVGDGAHGHLILVVDDSATVRKLISNKLEKSGHTVTCAEDGIEAMHWLDSNTPDLILLDITMPRMDGYQVCKQIRARAETKDVPVVMISGKDGFFDKVRGRLAGTTGYITKPFGPETLMKALETYLTQAAE